MDPALKFVVDVQNSEKVAQLTSHIKLQTDAISALNAQLKAGAINDAQFAASSRVFGESAAAATREVKALEAAGHGAGRGLGQLAYAVDDIQYGFNAIVNNIPGIVMGLGGSAGIAGAAGIAAVAINQLYKHWGELSDMLQGAWYGDAPGQLKALREQAEEAAAAFEKLAKVPTKGQETQVKGTGEAITEAGTKQLATALAIRMRHDPNFKLKPEDIDFTLAEVAGLTPVDKQRRIGEAFQKKAEALIGQSQKPGAEGDAARLQLRKLAPEIAQDIEDASPEGQARIAQKRLDLAGGRLGRKQEEKAADADAKKVDALNLQGQQFQREGEQKEADARKRERIQNLQDQRDMATEKHHKQDLRLQQIREDLGHPTQILSGAKAVVDYFQKGVGDAPLVALAKATKEIQEQQRDELKEIHAELVKEQRIKPQ